MVFRCPEIPRQGIQARPDWGAWRNLPGGFSHDFLAPFNGKIRFPVIRGSNLGNRMRRPQDVLRLFKTVVEQAPVAMFRCMNGQ